MAKSMCTITIRYLGILRLKSGKRVEEFCFNHDSVLLREVLHAVQVSLAGKFAAEMLQQTLVLAPALDQPGMVLQHPLDLEMHLPNGSCLTLVTPLTGG